MRGRYQIESEAVTSTPHSGSCPSERNSKIRTAEWNKTDPNQKCSFVPQSRLEEWTSIPHCAATSDKSHPSVTLASLSPPAQQCHMRWTQEGRGSRVFAECACERGESKYVRFVHWCGCESVKNMCENLCDLSWRLLLRDLECLFDHSPIGLLKYCGSEGIHNRIIQLEWVSAYIAHPPP